MSYNITCYSNDSNISSTTISVSSLGYSHTCHYGDSEFKVTGFPDGNSARFTASPASNCSFTRWVYRLGSTTGTVHYDYNNPFTYSGSQDIFIRAEGSSSGGGGGDDEPSWTRFTRSVGTITSNYQRNIDLDEYELYRFSVSFSNSGTATFYTTGSVDTYGYLSTTSGWDSDSGTPSSYIARNDDGGSGSNFSISYNVTAEITYYVWVRGYDGTETGSVVLNITPPENTPSAGKWVWSFSIGDSLSVDSHGIHPMTATEWNNFTTRINEFRAYLGDDPAPFTTVTQYQKFTPSIYNEAVYAIKSAKDGNSYGAYVNYINNSTLAISNSIFQISLLNSLASEANAMAGYT